MISFPLLVTTKKVFFISFLWKIEQQVICNRNYMYVCVINNIRQYNKAATFILGCFMVRYIIWRLLLCCLFIIIKKVNNLKLAKPS